MALFSATLITLARSPLLEIAWPLLLFFGFFLVTGVFLEHGQVHVLSAMPTYAGEFATLSAVAFNHLFANRERERLREAFNRFLDKTLVDELVEQQKLPSLEGETREITAFFSDIRGFSTFSERFKDDPKALVRPAQPLPHAGELGADGARRLPRQVHRRRGGVPLRRAHGHAGPRGARLSRGARRAQ